MNTLFTPIRAIVGILPLLLTSAPAATVTAVFESAATVPVTAEAYTAAGNEVTFALNFAPPAGTALTVVNHTGTDAIHGTFENLGQWQAVELSHDGVVYRFVANYFGGTGNDLVLEWAHTRPLAWGGATFNFGQLGNGSITNSSIAVPVDMSGVLAGKTVVRTATGSGHSVALCADGALAAWGENSTHALGNTGTANSSVPVMVDWSGIPAGKTVVAITAGARHNLALCADGSVVAWGSNSSGQLGGSGTAASWSLPILVDQTGVLAGRTVIAVAAGGTHNLALCTDGTLAAWGSNSYGQLGTNSTTNSPVPVLVNTSGVLAGKTVTAIAAGNSHSMALCSDGTLAVWGYNASGQLGNNSVTNSAVPVLVQQTGVLAGKPLAAIAAGYAHCLVLCADGTLAAWGENASGQLGNGGTTSSKVPVLVNQTGVLAGKTVATISAGSSCSLAQCADGTVATWGGNSSGSLGNNSTTGSTVPVAVTTTMLRTGERFARAETGHNSSHSLAIVAMPPPPVGLTLAATDIIDTGATLNASVNAQGTSATVAFEYGLTTSYGATVAAIPGSASGTAATVASARLSGLPAGTTYHYRVVATGTSGTAKGEDMTFTTTTAASLTGLTPSAGTLFPALASDTVNYVAAVPHATASITLTPVCPNGDAVVTINGAAVASGTASGPLALAVGNNVINTVVAAGGGTNTQTYVLTVTRLPATFTYDTATDTPVTVDDFLAAGHTADFALNFTPAPGTILSVVKNTGMNPIQGAFTNLAQGQIVNLTRDGVSYPFVANYFGGTGNDLVLQWGSNRSLAWGENTYGTLGTNSQYGSSSPVPVRSNDASAGKVIIANATGNHYRLALCADGALLAWGRNDFGQLGNNGNQHSFEAVLVDRTGVLAGKTVIAVAAGTSHSLALCADGTLAAWGSNYSGQLGNRGADNASVPVRVDQTGVLAGRKIVAIAAGTGTSFALCADGRVAAWGDNTNGRLGNGSTLHSSVPVWVDHSGALAGKSVVALGAGWYYTVVLCADGTLAAWGQNSSGQLGNNSTTSSGVPVLVNQTGVLAGRAVTAIAVGGAHTLALCADGFLAAWGSNTSGQLGNNSTTVTNVPVAVNRTGVLAGKTITSIAAGDTHSLALCADGVLAAWGSNGDGQLGVGDTTQRITPTAVIRSVLAAGESITSVNCGAKYSLAMVATPPQPVATSLAATEILDTRATLRGTVNANGTSPSLSFEFGPTTSYGATVAATPATASGTGITAASATLDGLRAGTTYHYRIVATGPSGAVKGGDMTFTTSALATLANLSLSAGTLSPAFSPETADYVTTVPFGTTALALTPVVAAPGATVTVAGTTVASGSASAPLALTTGGNAIDIVVSAPGGGNLHAYRVTVTRLPQTLTCNSATDPVVTAAGFSAAGDAPPLALNFAPEPGSSLTLVNNTGTGWIAGTFANLAQGQRVQLSHAGITYEFVVNYFGGSGNDLVLHWANTRLLAWGRNTYGQLGNNSSTLSSNVAVPVDMGGALAGRTVVGIASGGDHGLALCADGTLAAWGYNNYGQLGNNGTSNSRVPVPVDRTGVLAGKTVVAIAAGASHNLALCADGTLAAWGYNVSGQLGDNSSTNRLIPVAVDLTGVLADKAVVAIAAGGSHSLALCADGTLAAWGSNSSGQLGNNAPLSSAVPVLVDRSGELGGKTVAAIAAGRYHCLALCADGTLVAWGNNTYGQLGNNSTSNSRIPVMVPQNGALAGKSVTAITGGHHDFSLCLCADGTAAGWGYNATGQLGNNSTANTSVPVAVTQTGAIAGKRITALAAGGGHSLARCADGTVAAWGNNGDGQLGNNSTTNSTVPVAGYTAGLQTGERFTAVSGGSSHSLGLTGLPPAPSATTLAATAIHDQGATINASVSAQGTTAAATLEYGPTTAYGTTLTPEPASVTGTAATTISATISGLPPATTFHYRVTATGPGGTTTGEDLTFTTGAMATLAGLTLDSGTLTPAFTPARRDYLATVPAPVETITLTPVAATPSATILINGIAATSGTPCAPINLPAGETVISIVVAAPDGSNTLTYTVKVTRLPLAFTYNSAADVPLTVSEFVATGNDALIELNHVPAPGASLTVVRSTGIAPITGAFGNLAHGQTVNLAYGGISYPFVVNYRGGTGNDLVLHWANMRMLSWGNNAYGQLGNHEWTNRSVAGPVELSGPLAGKTPLAVAAGESHALALCADGTLASWGYGNYGQLGNGGTSSRNIPWPVDQTGVLAGKTIVSVDAGSGHSLALCADGTLAAWGGNWLGQLGNNGSANSNVPVTVVQSGALAGKTVISIAAGRVHNLALCADGTLAAWGGNSYGQLGNGSTSVATGPVLVSRTGALAGKSVVAIAAGGNHSLALCADGTLAAWGYNSEGQLGNGSTANSSIPVAVTATGMLAGKAVAMIAAGAGHNLALCTDGTLAAWGANGYGQLGNRGNANSSVPVAVDATGALAGKTVVACRTGYNHSLALCEDGTLATWGYNSVGQLGNHSTTNSNTPVVAAASALGAGERITTAPGGGEFSLALVAMPPPPVATTLAARDVADTAARLSANVNASGTSATVTFEYGLTTDYGSTLDATPATVSGGATTVNATAGGLLPGTTYHFRVVARGAGGTTAGQDMTFTTSAIATLADLSLGGPALSPAFSSINTGYLASVPDATHSITVTAVATLPSSTVTINGITVPSGSASAPLNLQPGENAIDITVTAADGVNTCTYLVKVARLPGSLAFGSDATVPMTLTDLAPAGALPEPTLEFAPAVGTDLVLVTNTGRNPIRGWFENLPQGRRVSLPYQGITYDFVADYFGGTGNDLVLQWAGTCLLGWGANAHGQLGNNSSSDSRVATPVDINGALAGKTVVATANGYRHTLALCADGTVAAWGDNTSGQLGNGTRTASNVPVPVNQDGVLAGKTVIAIAASGSHSLALCADGTLAEWGYFFRGEANHSDSLPAPVDQTGVLAGKTVTAIAAGDDHSVALCSDGTLAAWGYNERGQLGNNDPANSSLPVLVSRAGVLAGKTVTAIAGGAWHSLALCADGTLAAWGYNSNGQLGNNSTAYSSVPVAVTQTGVLAGKTVTAMAGGGIHSLALCSDGTLAAWGYNNHGQLGNGSTTHSSVPVGVLRTGALLGKTIIEVSGGGYHSLARCADGTVATWGSNAYGQLGNNSTTSSSVPVTVAMNALMSGSRVVTAAAGSQHCMAVAAIPPLPQVATLAATDIRDAAATLKGMVNANSTDRAVSFEYGLTQAYGSTAAATPETATGSAFTEVSAAVSGLLPGTTYHYRVIASTGYAITKGDDMTFTTGVTTALANLSPDHGTLSPAFAGSREDYLATVPFATTAITLTPIAADNTSTVAINGVLTPSGAAAGPFDLAVGGNDFAVVVTAADGGQTKTYHLRMTRLPESFTYSSAADAPLVVGGFNAAGEAPPLVLNDIPEPGTRWTLVSNTGMDPIQGTFANLPHGQVVHLPYGGAVYAFVADYSGGSGNDLVLQWANTRLLAWGVASGMNRSYAAPLEAAGALAGKTVLAADAGNDHGLALCADGTMAAWGSNGAGQLGNGSTADSAIPVQVAAGGVLAGKSVRAIAAGNGHNLALCADGTLAAWGSNNSGQLGNGSTTTSAGLPVLVNQAGVLAGKTVIAIAAGSGHSLALCADGTLAAWGNNASGQLGNATTVNSNVPVRVSQTGALAGRSVTAIAAGATHSLALCADGAVVAWGSGTNGQLGNRKAANSDVPVRVDPSGLLANRTVTAIAAGGYYSLALCTDGIMAAWGSNGSGQLGNNTKLDSYSPVRVNPTGVLANKQAAGIAAASVFSLAVCTDGSAVAWGNNSSGQLGNFSTTSSLVPVSVTADLNGLPASMRFMTVSGGATHSIGLAACAMPSATTLPATALTDSGATINGRVNANGNATTVSFEYGLTSSYGQAFAATPAFADGGTDTEVSATLTGLVPGATYHYRLVATSSGVLSKGADMTFTINRAPVFAGYAFGTPYQTAVSVALRKLLAKASDPDGDSLTLTAAGPATSRGGTAALQAGLVRYTPPDGFAGTDTFSVTITDPQGASVVGTVTVTVAPPGGHCAGSLAANPPQLTPQPDGGMAIKFQVIPGRTYRIERSLDLTAWTEVATVTATDAGEVFWTDTNPPQPSAFYRLASP